MRVNHKLCQNRQRAYAKRVDIVIVSMIKSLGFVPKFNDARAGWLLLNWTEITEPVTLPQFAGGQIMEISGCHTTGQWQKNILFAFCHCCG
jgi:hypothetical protein